MACQTAWLALKQPSTEDDMTKAMSTRNYSRSPFILKKTAILLIHFGPDGINDNSSYFFKYIAFQG